MTSFCQDCDEVHSDTRNLDPWKWRCHRAPIKPGYGFVSRDWAPHPPYDTCARRNPTGECKDFKRRREPPKPADPDKPF